MIAITKYLIYITPFLAILIAFKQNPERKKALLVMLVAGIFLIYPLTELVKLFIQEPRPFVSFHLQPLIKPPADLSFPSGHASFMAVLASAFLIIRSKWAWLFVALALLVGFSRIYVGVHYPLDVLGGLVLGFIITFMILKFSQIWRRF